MAPVMPPIAPYQHVQRIMAEPEEHGESVSGIALSLEIIRRHERPGIVDQFQNPDWALDFGQAHVHARVQGAMPGDWVSFCLVRGGECTWGGIPGRPWTLYCLPPGEELDGRIRPGLEWATVALPPEAWRRCQSLAGAEGTRLQRFAGWRLPPRSIHRIGARQSDAESLLGSSEIDPLGLAGAANAGAAFAAEIAISAWELAAKVGPPRDALRNRFRLARRADAWMRERLSEPTQVLDVCLAMRVSRRELEYAFRAAFDQSPSEHLRMLRLNAIRQALLRGDRSHDTVARIAVEHGIMHFGRFSAHYSSLFGEYPSATLQNR